MKWDISFMTEEQLTEHIRKTIEKYGDKLESIDLKGFNKNVVDPIKLLFDNYVYKNTWEETVKNELFRQRDKANNNDIGYFHQRIFSYFDGCKVPDNGKDGGWDIIYKNKKGICLPDGDCVHTAYIEMKNKHNTMNSSSAAKTFIKMQSQLLKDDDCVCFLAEAVAKKSQNIKWETTVEGIKVRHKLIRRISIDRLYELVTGERDAFYKVCMQLPRLIIKAVNDNGSRITPNDTVFHELTEMAKKTGLDDNETAMAMAVYMLGFSDYNGFARSEEK